MERAAVEVQGLQELLDSFKQLGDGLPKALSTGLRTVARGVAADAQAIADAKGLHDTGALIAKITTSVRGTVAYIVDTAKRVSPKYPDGYAYPKVYEYGGRGGDAVGPRAFIHPAIAKDEDQIFAGVEQLVDQLITQAGF